MLAAAIAHCILFCIVFIHFYSASHIISCSEGLRAKRLTMCRYLHAEALQTTASEGFAQDP